MHTHPQLLELCRGARSALEKIGVRTLQHNHHGTDGLRVSRPCAPVASDSDTSKESGLTPNWSLSPCKHAESRLTAPEWSDIRRRCSALVAGQRL